MLFRSAAVARTKLCELCWESLDDPRAELRWCLSRIRRFLDEPSRARLETRGDFVRIDLSDLAVDAVTVVRAAAARFDTLAPAAQREVLDLFRGEFLEGLELDDSPQFVVWLTAQRQKFRSLEIVLLELMASRVPDAEAYELLERWRALAPFDLRVHERLLAMFACRSRFRDRKSTRLNSSHT